MKWFDAVKKEIYEGLKFEGPGDNAHLKGSLPRDYRHCISPWKDPESFFDNQLLSINPLLSTQSAHMVSKGIMSTLPPQCSSTMPMVQRPQLSRFEGLGQKSKTLL